MAATVTARGNTWTTTAGNKTVVATPAVNDLIVVIAASSGTATTAVTDTQSGTYVKVDVNRTGFDSVPDGTMNAWVRTALIPAASSTTWTATQTSSTGGGLIVYSVSGMTLTGASAVRSSGGQSSGTAATTPAPVLSLTPSSANPIIVGMAAGKAAGGAVTPRTGYTEDMDLGYSTPATSLETMHLASGETSATLTYGSTVATTFATIALELEYNSAPTVVLNSPADASSTSDTTPELDFTGTDANSDDIRYNAQVDIISTFGDLVTADSYATSNQDSTYAFRSDITQIQFGQSFTGNDSILDSVQFMLSRTSSPTGLLIVKLYAHSGTFGTSGVPTGAALATSDGFDVSTLDTSLAVITFTFNDTNRVTLTNGTNYIVALDSSGLSDVSPNQVNIGRDASSPTHAGNACWLISTTWTASSTIDFPFAVFTIGSPPVIDSYAKANSTGLSTTIGVATGNIAASQSFTGNGSILGSIQAYLADNTSSAGNITAQIFAHSGTFGTSSVPTGSALATSDNIPSATIATGGTPILYSFEFSGLNQITLTNGTKYVLVVNGSPSAGLIGWWGGAASAAGNAATKSGSTWTATGSYDLIFYVNSLIVPPINKFSNIDTGFIDITNGADTDPFASTNQISYTVQAGDALSLGTYYWRIRGIDPSGSNTYGAWSATRSLIISAPSTIPNKIIRINQAINRAGTY